MNRRTLGILLALFGSLLFSTKAVLVKLAYRHDIDSISLLLLRMIFALPIYLVILAQVSPGKFSEWRRIPAKYWIGLFIAAALGYYLSSLLDFIGLQYIDASVERLILFIYPTFVAALNVLLFRERLTKIQMGALLISYVGLVCVFGQNLNSISLDQAFWWGSVLILICALTFALFLVLSQWLIPHFGSKGFTSLSMTVACCLVIVHYSVLLDFDVILDWPWQVFIIALAMAILATVLPSYLINFAIDRIGATQVGIISSVGPISTITLAYLLLDERLEFTQILGAFMIILGVSIVSFEVRRQRKTGPS